MNNPKYFLYNNNVLISIVYDDGKYCRKLDPAGKLNAAFPLIIKDNEGNTVDSIDLRSMFSK